MKTLLTTLLIIAGFATVAIAQDAEQSESKLPAFETVDENEDGRIDQAELALLLELLEDTDVEFDVEVADANRDGLIDPREYAAYEEMLS